MNVLIIDDQRSARRILSSILQGLSDMEIKEAATLEEARAILLDQPIDVALIDIRLGIDIRNRDGLTLVQEVSARTAAVPIVVTASRAMSEIRAAMRFGAYDYLLKEEICEELVIPLIEGLRSRRMLEREVQRLRARCTEGRFPHGLIGASAPMERLRTQIRRVALSDRPVLVVGPTGAGKELVVGAIHALGAAPDAPLLDINCGAIPEALVESQLFGHERGAFTGADRRQEGYLTAVQQGTLFLDEIAELPLSLQAKLLRVLETGRFRAIGATAERRFQGRVIAATHADLEQRVRERRFREDLFYRLGVLCVPVPALDEHREDIPELVAHFIRQQQRPLRFSTEAMEVLCQRSWPGNVRQLRNLVDRLSVFSDRDLVSPAELLALPAQRGPQEESSLQEVVGAILRLPLSNKVEGIVEALIEKALSLSEGNKTAAARLLGVHRKVIERRLDRHRERGSKAED